LGHGHQSLWRLRHDGLHHAKVRENYGRRFRITYPNEFLAGARPLQTSPIHDRLTDANAVWGNSFGLESAQWFAADGDEPVEELTWNRSNAWEQVRSETQAVRTGVGLIETTGFAKFEFAGPGAREFLGRLLAGRIPKQGRMSLTPMTNERGKLIGDLTLACLPPAIGDPEGPSSTVTGGASANDQHGERFLMFGSGIAERCYQRYFDQQITVWQDDGNEQVSYTTAGYEMCGLSIAGPRSRELLERLTHQDVSADAFGFMDFHRLDLGMVSVLCGRVTFTGDLGYEFWMPASYQRHLFDLLMTEGAELGIRLFGSATLNSLRLEKSFGSWAREYRPLYDPFEANLGRFVQMGRDFIGRDALVGVVGNGPERTLCTWTIDVPDGPEAADAMGDEPVWLDGKVVGWITSGGYAHASETSVALGYVPTNLAGHAAGWEVEILGVKRPATLRHEPIWDPEGSQMRS
jgi:dimethylglycine dehydrogenase